MIYFVLSGEIEVDATSTRSAAGYSSFLRTLKRT